MIASGAAPQFKMSADKQLVEITGRHRLIEQLHLAGIEIAYPARDRGIDLIAYRDAGTGSTSFSASPIRMKATIGESFSINRKYERFPGLLLVFVWHIPNPANTITFALSYEEALQVATQMGYTTTSSWTEQGKYSCTKIGGRLRGFLEPYKMTAEKWQTKLSASAKPAPATVLQA